MKNIGKYIHGLWVLSCCTITWTTSAQSFSDLNFESATLAPTTGPQPWPDYVPIASALPNWSANLGSVQQSQVSQNTFTGGTASIDILGPNWGSQTGPGGFPLGVIDGNYSVFLQTGVGPPDYTGGVNTSIAQTGLVSASAQSVQFKAAFDVNELSVSFDGNNLPLVTLSTGQAPSGQSYTVYGVDIAPYAGQTGQLEFTEVFDGSFPSVELDDVKFSTTAVPEPSILMLTAMGGLLCRARKWFAQR